MKDILDVVYLWTYKKLLTQWITKYCYLNLTTMVFVVYQITSLNPTFKQFVYINGYDSGLAEINCGVAQGSPLGCLLFLLYINDLNQAIKSCKAHHFADDTNLLYLGKSIKKFVNFVLKNLVYWLSANKISLSIKKAELVIFKSKWKQFDGELKLKLTHKRLFPTDSVKYLGVKIDGNLLWKSHIDYMSVKLNRANALYLK